MASKEEVMLRITSALNEKAGGQKPCVICSQTKWVVMDKFAVITVGNDPEAVLLGGHTMPLVPVVCINCGNTQFVNLKILGFTDMSLLKIDDDADAKS